MVGFLSNRLSFVAFLCAMLVCTSAQNSPTRPSHLSATDAFARWVRQQSRSGLAQNDPQVLASGVELAVERNREMRSLIASDPAEFLRRAMPASERASLPLQIQPLIEQRFKGRGSFRVYCLGVPPEGSASFPESAKGNGYGREVRLNGITYQAFVSGQWKNQTSLSDASIDGIILNDAIALVDAHARPAARHSTPGPRPSSDRLYLPARTGPNTLLYI